MQVDSLFDHARVDVITTTQNQVFESVYQEEMSFFIHITHVSGPQPPISKAVGCFLFTIEIAFHDLRTLDPHFTAFSGSNEFVRRFEAVDGYIGAWGRHSDRVFLVLSRERITGCHG